MNIALDFVRFNLLPGIAAGALMWAVVSLGVWLLRVRQGKLRLCLFAAPLAKSTLVILGVAPALAWRVAPFDAWFASAVPPATVVPWFLLATGIVLAARAALDRKATACDDVAVAVVGDSQAYAGMLLEGFRFARIGGDATSSPLRYATRLVGMRPAISERIERVLDGELRGGHGAETVAFLCIWVLLIGVFFTG